MQKTWWCIETHIHLEPCFDVVLKWLNTWGYHKTRNQNFGRNDQTTKTSHRISILFASLQSTSTGISTSIYVVVTTDQALANVLCRKKFRPNPPCYVCTTLSVESKWIQRVGKHNKEISLSSTDDLIIFCGIRWQSEVRFTPMHSSDPTGEVP